MVLAFARVSVHDVSRGVCGDYIGWIDSAKRAETKEKRLREAIGLLAAGKKIGLK